MAGVLEQLGGVWKNVKASLRSRTTDPKWVGSVISHGDASAYGLGQRQMTENASVLTSWVAICADKIASAASQSPIRLYRKARGGRKARRITDRKTLRYLADPVHGKAAAYAADNIEEVMEHEVLDLINRPNTIERSGQALAYSRFFDREWSGNAFTYVDGTSGMYRLPPQDVRMRLSRTEFVDSYIVNRAGYDTTFDADEVMHSRLKSHTFVPWFGWSWVNWIIVDQLRHMASTRSDLSMWQSDARPDFILKLPPSMGAAQAKVAEEAMLNYFRGPNKRGRMMVATVEEVIPLQWQPKDLEGLASREDARKIIAAASGVPESEIVLNEANYSNGKTGRRQFLETTILGRQSQDAADLTEMLLPRFGLVPGDYWLVYDNPVPEDTEAMARRHSILVGTVLTVNEARQEMGYEAVQGGDEETLMLVRSAKEPQPTIGTDGKERETEEAGNPTEEAAFDEKTRTLARKMAAHVPDHRHDLGCCEGKDAPFDPLVLQIARALETVLSGWFAETAPRAAQQAEAKNPDAITVDPTDLQARLTGPLQRGMIAAGREAYNAYATGDPSPFRVVNAAAMDYLQTYVPKLAQSISDTLTEDLRRELGAGIEGGESIQELQRRVADVFGEATGIRSERIARTESATIVNNGNLLGWSAAGVGEKEWVLAPNPCPVCEAIAKRFNKPIPIDQPFFSVGDTIPGTSFVVGLRDIMAAPAHPMCRCIVAPVVR
jgi:phage portal protein BeeE